MAWMLDRQHAHQRSQARITGMESTRACIDGQHPHRRAVARAACAARPGRTYVHRLALRATKRRRDLRIDRQLYPAATQSHAMQQAGVPLERHTIYGQMPRSALGAGGGGG